MRSARVEADKLYPLGLSGTISETGVLTTQFIHIAGMFLLLKSQRASRPFSQRVSFRNQSGKGDG